MSRPKKAGDAGPSLDDLTPDPVNIRRHGDVNRQRIRDSLTEVGAGRSILINGDRQIIAGHGVAEQAKALGLKLQIVPADRNTLIAVQRADLTPAEQIRAALWDNRATDDGEYDVAMIAKLAADGQTAGIFSDQDLRVLKAAVHKRKPRRTDPDAVAAAPKRTKIKTGDLFQLGDDPATAHRVLCGDSMKPEDVAILMGDELADLMATDPPYAIYGSSTGIGSDISDDKMVRPFFLEILRLASDRLKTFGHAYVCCDWRSWPSWWEMGKRTDLAPKNLLVWDKGGAGLGSSYANSYEMVGFFAKLPKQTVMTSGQRSGQRQVHKPNLWRGNRVPGGDREHNAQKPVALMTFLIENSSDPGGIVLEPFSGSGTTLIACEERSRRCRAMEIDPRYVQLTIARWEQFTEQKATQIGG